MKESKLAKAMLNKKSSDISKQASKNLFDDNSARNKQTQRIFPVIESFNSLIENSLHEQQKTLSKGIIEMNTRSERHAKSKPLQITTQTVRVTCPPFQNRKKSSSTVHKNKLKPFSPLYSFFILQILMTLFIPAPTIYNTYTYSNDIKGPITVYLDCLLFAFLVWSSIYMVWGSGLTGAKQLLMIYIHLDNIFLVTIATIISIVAMLEIFKDVNGVHWQNMIGVPLVQFSIAANCKMVIKWVKLSSWQLIIYKVCIIFDAMAFFASASYYMFVGWSPSYGMDPKQDEKSKDLLLLFTFANFALFLEINAVINSKDKSANLQHKYKIQYDEFSPQSQHLLLESRQKE